MLQRTTQGAFRLFRLFGVDVYLHWTWFLLLAFIISLRDPGTGWVWPAVEVVLIFAIVLMHEFGHALACKSVGGISQSIMLWPLGGVAFSIPPRRPGATLWTIAAGPLVNVLLAPLLFVLASPASPLAALLPAGVDWVTSDLREMARFLFHVNLVILVFNLLPIYPLDGGQILHSLLWFFLGWARSLMIVAGLGFVAALAAGAAVIYFLGLGEGRIFTLLVILFIASQAYQGFRYAQALLAQQRRAGGQV